MVTLTLPHFKHFLRSSADEKLTETPFRDWNYIKTVEDYDNSKKVSFEYIENGIDFVCNEESYIETIFIYFNEERFCNYLENIYAEFANKSNVLFKVGESDKSGSVTIHKILGNIGSWDLYYFDDHSLHFEYSIDYSHHIRKITIMTIETTP